MQNGHTLQDVEKPQTTEIPQVAKSWPQKRSGMLNRDKHHQDGTEIYNESLNHKEIQTG